MNNRRDEKRLNKLLEEDLSFKEECLRYILGDEILNQLISENKDFIKDVNIKGGYN